MVRLLKVCTYLGAAAIFNIVVLGISIFGTIRLSLSVLDMFAVPLEEMGELISALVIFTAFLGAIIITNEISRKVLSKL